MNQQCSHSLLGSSGSPARRCTADTGPGEDSFHHPQLCGRSIHFGSSDTRDIHSAYSCPRDYQLDWMPSFRLASGGSPLRAGVLVDPLSMFMITLSPGSAS